MKTLSIKTPNGLFKVPEVNEVFNGIFYQTFPKA